jgi:beta-glucosidase
MLAEYFDADFTGSPKLSRVEPRPFQLGITDDAVTAAFPKRDYAVRWTGILRASVTGEYVFAPKAAGRGQTARVFLDDKEIAARAPTPLEAGREHHLRVEYRSPGPAGSIQLMWAPPAAALLAEAVDAVKSSDVAIAFVGLNPNLEGEEMRVTVPGFLGGDRTDISLPEPQEKLLEAVVATGKPVIVVLTSGSALAVNFAAERAAAVLEAWYAGEEAGTAVAETLAGINNPAGRLPVTFYRSVKNLPPFEDYSMTGRTYRYFKGDPLYGFGFGLSYSTFRYSGLKAARTAKGAQVSVRVRNDSARDGDEVVQLYLNGGDPQLRGFQRVHLRAGETREVQFTIAAEDLPKTKIAISVGGGQPTAKVAHVTGTL